jgi:hypothetical protein
MGEKLCLAPLPEDHRQVEGISEQDVEKKMSSGLRQRK